MKKNLFFWAIAAVMVFSLLRGFEFTPQSQKLNYSEFIAAVQEDRVAAVELTDAEINGKWRTGGDFVVVRPPLEDQGLIGDLLEHDVAVEGSKKGEPNLLAQLLVASFPILLIIGALYFLSKHMQNSMGGRGGPLNFGRNRAQLRNSEDVKVTFADVAGVDEARDDVQELVDFLREPERFERLGGKIPRGVLMVGAPGTGKTLLAKAIAGEAKVPFFSISGSDFVEMFVGVGASRVRDLFEQARKLSPCIVFIDEIDAVGRHRGAGLGGGHDEREQTLNQLLVEMDGFEPQEGIIVIAATNRPDVLDPALLRPGRFDRQVVVNLPDILGRTKILSVHTRKLPLSEDVDLKVIARGTPGFSGADLANLVNEAALQAARQKRTKIRTADLDYAKDKIMMGTERRTLVMTDDEKWLTAYHEAGHAIIGRLIEGHDPVYKVTIIPRGRALGVTMFLPEEDRYSQSRKLILGRVCSLLGGRLAEELIYGKDGVTTGAANDISHVTDIVRNMVTKWGLSDKLGPLRYSQDDEEVFLGRLAATGHAKSISAETAREIDREVRSIINQCLLKARRLLEDNRSVLDNMARALIDYESLDSEQLDLLMAGEKLPPLDVDNLSDKGSDNDQNGSINESETTVKDSEGELQGAAPATALRN